MRCFEVLLLTAVAMAATVPCHAVPDATGAVSSTPAPDLSADAAMTARLHYNLGFEQFEKMQKLEGSVGGLSGAKARKAREDALAGYAQAREHFRTAANADPAMKEAWNLIGYTSRRLGEYEESLAAYDAALKLSPEYPEAIEYRAELYLLTGRLDDARAAYAWLAGAAPSYAGVLAESMRKWVEMQRQQPTVTPGERDAFATWLIAQPSPQGG